jgi:hypothetical protein
MYAIHLNMSSSDLGPAKIPTMKGISVIYRIHFKEQTFHGIGSVFTQFLVFLQQASHCIHSDLTDDYLPTLTQWALQTWS